MPINNLYHAWFQRVGDLRSDQRIAKVRNFVRLIIGIYQTCSVCLSRMAGKIPGSAKLLSMTHRLSGLLDNPADRVREWYAPITREWLEKQFRHLGEIHLIVDGTKIGFGHQRLIVCPCQAELKVSTNQELKKSTFQDVNLSTRLLSEFFNIPKHT
jgi:hypothetical protein